MTDAYPLQWPVGRSRTPDSQKKWGGFKATSSRIRQELSQELSRMGVSDFVISSNVAIRRDGLPYAGQKAPDDSGVALYFTRKGKEICISCDQYIHLDSNLRAIGLTIAAIRGMERWGTEEMVDRAFTGFAALPESTIVTPYQARAWYEVLEVSPSASQETIRAAYRSLLLKNHPDQGGDVQKFHEIQKAFKEATS